MEEEKCEGRKLMDRLVIVIGICADMNRFLIPEMEE